MVQYQIKLRPCVSQERIYDQWLFHLTSVHNWAVRKIELNASNKIYFPKQDFQNLLADHGPRIGIPSHTLQGVLCTVHDAWRRCFKNLAGRPRLKGTRNKLASIPFPDPIGAPRGNRITIPGIGSVRFHRQNLPSGKIKCGRIVKRASGWYLCLFIDVEPKMIERTGFGEIGIDPGFSNLLTTSGGEVIRHPRELEVGARRLAQAQRGSDDKLVARLHERIANQKKDRNHKLARRLVAENVLIAWSKDNIKGIAKKFGKSVASSAHAQLRRMLAYKSPKSGTQFIEVASNNSTKTCSECGSLSGPTGLAGLSVRHWGCPCGAEHNRDINAAVNTLISCGGIRRRGGLLSESVWNPKIKSGSINHSGFRCHR